MMRMQLLGIRTRGMIIRKYHQLSPPYAPFSLPMIDQAESKNEIGH